MREPIKLYCIEDYNDWYSLTKGKVYELFPNGDMMLDGKMSRSAGDGTWEKWSKENPGYAANLVPLVSRPAKVDEWVYVTNPHNNFGGANFKKGEVIKITHFGCMPSVKLCGGRYYGFANDEYLVLDGYKPDEGEKKMKYSVGDRVEVIGGDCSGRRGVIIGIKSEGLRPYLVSIDGWSGGHTGGGHNLTHGKYGTDSNCWWCYESELERKVDMTKDDLKTGKYMVKCRNGYFGNTIEGTNYVNGLTDEFNSVPGDGAHDLMEIYELRLIWKREETVKMTMEEINAALGKNIEVVEKH